MFEQLIEHLRLSEQRLVLCLAVLSVRSPLLCVSQHGHERYGVQYENGRWSGRDVNRELNGLVAAYHHRTNRPHGSIHAQLRAACGGPPVAMASTEDLQRRIAEIHRW